MVGKGLGFKLKKKKERETRFTGCVGSDLMYLERVVVE
jgi:hypothetical protein